MKYEILDLLRHDEMNFEDIVDNRIDIWIDEIKTIIEGNKGE